MEEPNTQKNMPAYEDMVKAGMHFGRKKTIFHPAMGPYVHTLRDNIYILDLIKTNELLAKAIDFLKDEISAGHTILFTGLTKQSAEVIKKTAETLNMPYVSERWLGGTLTNFKTIISRVKYLEDLERQKLEDGFEKYTKRERVIKEREIEALKKKFDGIRKLTKLPEIVFISSLKESQIVVKEAKIAGIKIVGIVNTDSNPKEIDYPIPANDNSKKSVELILDTIKKGLQK